MVICNLIFFDVNRLFFLQVGALRRASAGKVTVVMPYYGYARQDRKMARTAIGAAEVARILAAVGVNHAVTLDLHAGQIQGNVFCTVARPTHAHPYLHNVTLHFPTVRERERARARHGAQRRQHYSVASTTQSRSQSANLSLCWCAHVCLATFHNRFFPALSTH